MLLFLVKRVDIVLRLMLGVLFDDLRLFAAEMKDVFPLNDRIR